MAPVSRIRQHGRTSLTTGGSVAPFVRSPQVRSGDGEEAKKADGGEEKEGRRRRGERRTATVVVRATTA